MFKAGDVAFIVESNIKVREVQIRSCIAGMYTISFADGGGAIRVKNHRLFATREEAEATLPQKTEKKYRSPYM